MTTNENSAQLPESLLKAPSTGLRQTHPKVIAGAYRPAVAAFRMLLDVDARADADLLFGAVQLDAEPEHLSIEIGFNDPHPVHVWAAALGVSAVDQVDAYGLSARFTTRLGEVALTMVNYDGACEMHAAAIDFADAPRAALRLIDQAPRLPLMWMSLAREGGDEPLVTGAAWDKRDVLRWAGELGDYAVSTPPGSRMDYHRAFAPGQQDHSVVEWFDVPGGRRPHLRSVTA